MITYSDIYDATRKEKYSEQLQELPKNFIYDFSEYMKEKKEMFSKEEDSFSDSNIKTKKQLENALTLFKELMLRRRKKILNLILVASEIGISKRDFDNMLDFEKELFEDLMKCLEKSDKNFIELLNGKAETFKNEMVSFKTDVEEFIGPDGEKLGGFKKGQIANLPSEIVEILVEDGKAERIEQ